MRKIIAAEFMTIDGVIRREEADGDGFKYCGWFFPVAVRGDGRRGAGAAGETDGSAAHGGRPLTVGRRTGRRIRAFWPLVMTATKYVASNTRDSSDWQQNVFLSGDIAEKVRELKQQDGPDIYVMGSADLLQTLFKNDLVDEIELMTIPVTLGTGKRHFESGTVPASFKVTSSTVAPKGIICVTYSHDGDVKTGAPQIKEN